ncbi:MAG: cytochrome c biogenesis protein ResB, partial [Anaerolineae bacterium]|nr:cytochrome c biogenesis protein ResB [Anaerolineae bacterium]
VLVALAANGLACTPARVPGRWRVARGRARPGPPPRPLPPGMRAARFRAPGDGLQVEAILHRACRAAGLRPQVRQLGRAGALAAERGRWTALGTVAAHLALAVVGVGLLLTATQGERSRTPPLAPGQAHVLPWQPATSLHVREFRIDRYPDGRPRAYRLEVALAQGSGPAGPAREMALGAPAPLPGGGQAYLYGYGPAVQVEVRDRTGAVLLSGASVPLAPSASAALPDGRTLLMERATVGPGSYHVQVWEGGDLVAEGTGQARTPIALEDLEVILSPAQYVVLELVRDPGYPWVVGGVVAGLAGAAVALAGRWQQVCAFWQEGELLLWAPRSGSGRSGERAWQRLVREISASMGEPEDEGASGP